MAVSVYSTPSCGYCKQVKSWLREKGVRFNEYNVASDERRADEMMRKSGQMSVPVLDIHGKIVVGFRQEDIERALKR